MISEYGVKDAPCVVLIHPMLASADMMYNVIGSRFKGEYRIIAPDMGEHGRSGRVYISAADEAQRLYRYLDAQGIKEIALLYGASLGAVCAMELSKCSDIRIKEIYLDGIPFAQQPQAIAPVTGRIIDLWKRSGRGAEKIFSDMYTPRYGRAMAECFYRMRKETFIRIFRDCTDGCERILSRDRQKHLFFDYGEKEPNCLISCGKAKKMYPDAKFIIHRGYSHCDYLVKNPDRYVSRLEKIINR